MLSCENKSYSNLIKDITTPQAQAPRTDELLKYYPFCDDQESIRLNFMAAQTNKIHISLVTGT